MNQAENQTYTVPLEWQWNKENWYKMLQKKREMFLINKMIDKKKKESSKLEDYSTLRQDGLHCSEKMLAEDIKNFIAYF